MTDSFDEGEAPVLDAAVVDEYVRVDRIPLRELSARFVRITGPTTREEVHDITQADGVFFACPKCFVTNRGLRGTHYVLCWSPRVGQDVQPTPGRWNLTGSGLDDLTLVAGSSSVFLNSEEGCRWHGFVRDGHCTGGLT